MSKQRRSNGNGAALQAAISLAFVVPASAQPAPNARPQGGQVVAGSAAIAGGATTTTINQSSNRAAINWHSFDVGSQQSVIFNQPGASSVTLNRVTGPNPSAIAGRISANGQLVLTNPSGVVFHAGSQVNAQSVIVSAPGISNRNFMAGQMVFDQPGSPNARIENAGAITVKQAGLAALVAPSVANSGTITARLGHVVLAGAATHTLDMYGDGLVAIDVTKQVTQAPMGPGGKPVTALVTNSGTIAADGGTVQLTAHAADGVVNTLVQAGGRVQANTVGDRTGRIEIAGTGGSVVIEGRVAADGRAPGTAGGSVAVAGSDATILAPTARVSASGRAGGGTVAVGTTLARARGAGPAPAGTSARTSVSAGARLSADATASGSGGRVTVLSTRSTTMGGVATARGGPSAGNGGTIELSGETGFRLTGSADTSAPHGTVGTVVLDPRDLTIINPTDSPTPNQPPSNSDPNIAAADGGTTTDAFVTPAQIQQLTGNVRIQATRDLEVASNLTYQGGNAGGSSLILEAGRDLRIDSGVTVASPGATVRSGFVPGELILSAGTASIAGFDPAGKLTVLGNTQSSGLQLNAGTGGIVLGGTLSTKYHAGPTNLIDATGILTTGPVSQTGGGLITGALSGSAAGISLTATGNQISNVGGNGALTATAGGVSIATSTALTVTAGATGAGIVAPVGQAITLKTDSLDLVAGGAGGPALLAPGGTVSIQPYSPSTPIVLTSSTAKPEGALTLTTAETALINANTLRFAGPFSSLTFGQPGDAPIDLVANGNFAQVLLDVGGSVGQNATLSVNALARSPAAAVPVNISLADPANSIPVIRDLASRNDLVVTTSGDMVVSGGIAAASSLELSAGNNLLIGADATLSGPTSLYLSAGTANNTGALTVAGTVSVDDGGAFLAGSGGIALSGRVSLGGALDVSTTGALTQSGGSLSVDLLLGHAASVSLPSRGNALNGITSFTVDAGDFLLVNSQPTTVSAPGGEGGNVGLRLPAGHSATFVTDDLAISGPDGSGGGPVLDTGGGTLVVAPYTPGSAVLLTSGVKPESGLSLTTTELGLVDAATLQIGGTTPFAPQAGAITVGQAGDSPIDLGSLGISRLALSATGAVSQTVPLGVTTLAGSAGSVALADAGNFIQGLDGLAASGDIAVHTSSGLLVSNPVTSGGTLSLSSETPIGERGDNTSMLLAADLSAPTIRLDTTDGEGGATGIRQTAGIVTTGTLSGVADTLSLTQANQIINLGTFTAYNGLTLTNAQPLTVTGAVTSTGGPVTLNAPGIAQTAVSSISTPELDGSATADTVLNSRRNAIASVGSFTQSSGNFTLVTSTPRLGFGAGTGQVSAPTGSITIVADGVGFVPRPASGTSISAPIGSITFIPFTPFRPMALVDADSSPAAANAFALSTSFRNTLHTDVLALGQPGYAGTITFGGTNEVIDLSMFPALQVQTAGALSQGAGAVLTLASLTGSAGSISLPGNNRVASLGMGLGNTPIGLAATAGALTIGTTVDMTTYGPVSAISALTLSTAPVAGLSVMGSLTAPAVSLFVGGAVSQGPGSVISADTLSVSAGSARLASAGNRIGTLASTVSGDLTLADGTDLGIAGGSTVGGTLTLAVAGRVTGGPLTARALTGSAASVALTDPANRIASLGPFTTTGGFNLVTAQTLTVAGPVSDPGAISLTVARDLTLGGSLSSPGGVVTLNAGSITQPGGTIAAATLAGSVAGSATLGQAGNAIGTLAGFSTGGDLTLADGIGLGIAGSGTIGGTLNLAVAGPVTGGGITAAGLTGSATSLALTGSGTRIASLGPFATIGGFNLVDAQALTVTGTLSDPGAISLNVAGDLTLAASLNSPGGTVTLNARTITQPGGAITAGTLTGSAAQSATLAATGNTVATLAGFSTGGDFILADSRSLVVSAPVDPNTVSLTVNGDLTLNSSVTGSSVVLDVTGAVVEGPGGRIVADLLTLSAGSAALNGANQIATLGTATTKNGFSLADTGALTVGGPSTDDVSVALAASGPITLLGDVSAPSVSLTSTGGGITQSAGSLRAGTLTASATGALTQSGGALVAGTLSGSADSVDLGRGGLAAIDQITDLSATGQPSGSITVVDMSPLQIGGAVSGRFVSITSTGSLVLADGAILRTDGQPRSAQLGSADAAPGSNLSVRPGADGTASLVQAGRATIVPLTSQVATVRIDLPPAGGTVALNNLQASNADLVLNLGRGSATGTLASRNLTVLGSSGRATLSGSVGGVTGNQAAETAALLPRLDTSYTLNGCVISVATCAAPVTIDVPSVFQPEAAIASITSAISSVIRPDILALDVLDLSVTRDRDDPTLLLPNISDKDY